MSAGFQVLGFVLFMLSLAISFWAMRENAFAAPVARTSGDSHRPLRACQASNV